MKKLLMPRRTFLRGSGLTMALPLLEAMLPWWSERAMAQVAGAPRLVVLYKPNGQYPGSWQVNDFANFPTILQPLNPLKSQLTVVQGMNQTVSGKYPDGHAPRSSCYLTGGPILQSLSTIQVSKSIDHMVAESRGRKPLTLAGPFKWPNDGGYNTEYFSNISWVSPREDLPYRRPRDVFDMLFAAGGGTPSTDQINRTLKKSVIDYVLESANQKRLSLGSADRAKLDEYLTGVREIEKTLVQTEDDTAACVADMTRPALDNAFALHTKLMLDLLARALQCNRFDVSTYMMDCEVGGGYRDHHANSHWQENPSARAPVLREVDRWYVEQWAYFLGRLNSMTEGAGTVLSNSLVICGSGTGDNSGDPHVPNNIPIILAGRAKGALPNPGRILNKPGMTHCNFLLTVLNKMGVSAAKIGDSTGILADL